MGYYAYWELSRSSASACEYVNVEYSCVGTFSTRRGHDSNRRASRYRTTKKHSILPI